MTISKKQLQTAQEIAYNAGQRAGRSLAEQEAMASLRAAKLEAITALLTQGAALASANAKLTYSLQLLIEKAAK